MVDVAKEVGADAVSHGCTGKGNDQVCHTIMLAILCHVNYIILTDLFIIYKHLGSVCAHFLCSEPQAKHCGSMEGVGYYWERRCH